MTVNVQQNGQMKLKDVCELIVDCEHKTAPIQEEGYPSIRTPNIGRGRLILDGVKRVSEETYQAWTKREVPMMGDLILAREAPVGNVAIIPGNLKVCLGQRTVLIRADKNEVNNLYLLYLLLSDQMQGKLLGYSSGATVHHLNMRDIRNLELPELPEPSTQRKIAAILSSYDDLIENNQRRVQVLEESRKLIFQYFLKLGAKDVKRKTLGEISDESGGIIRTGPFGSQLHESDYAQEGVPVVMPKDIINGRVDTHSIAQVPLEVASRLSKHRLDVGDIVYGRRGDIGRRAFISERQEGWLCGTGCLRISLKGSALHPRFLYAYLGQQEVIEMIAGRAIGATMPNLNTTILRNISIDVPLYEVQKSFVEQVAPYDNLIENLVARNILLRQTRDLLLPKLISGDLDVEHLDINTEALDE